MTVWIGIDVSKLHLDAGWLEGGKKVHRKVRNSKKGFAALMADVPESAHFVMEATGTYYFNLALFLHQAQRFVAVVNPSQIKHHIKAELLRSKSDRSDSFSIAKFGDLMRPSAWKPHEREVYELRQLVALEESLQQKITQLGNMFEAFVQIDYRSEQALEHVQDSIRGLKETRAKVQKDMVELADKVFPAQVEILSSIPGVGKASAIKIMAEVGDFKRFATSKKLVSFSGLSPTLKQSGTSVRSKGHISRMGGERIRAALYMCAMCSLRYNEQCKTMWKRLGDEGKHGKIVMVALMAKLLRQMWAMVTKNESYCPNSA